MATICPKCGYTRQPSDMAPDYECPKCGIIYAKYNIAQQRKAEAALEEAERRQQLAVSPSTQKEVGAALPLKLIAGIAGSTLLMLGAFMPIVSFPIMGSINLFQSGKGVGSLILALAVAALITTLMKKYKWLWFVGLTSLGLISYDFYRVMTVVSIAKNSMKSDAPGGVLSGIAEAMANAVQIQWGWAVLFAGAIFLLAGAAMKAKG